jgi:hypothetical protein
MAANIIVSLCAVYGVIVTPRLPWEYIGNIWAYDLAWLVVIDACKIAVNAAIGNNHDDILEYSDLPAHLGVPPIGGSAAVGPGVGGIRNSNASARSNSTVSQHGRESGMSAQRRISHAQTRLSLRTSAAYDPAGAARASYTPRSSSLRPSLPANVAREQGSAAGWGAYGTESGAMRDAQYAAAQSAEQEEPLVSRLV